MKLLTTLLLLSLACGCSVKSSNSQSQAAGSPTQQTPKPTPYQFPQLTKLESQNLDRELPKDARQILEQSEALEILSIKSCSWGLNPDFSRTALTQNTPDKFQGCPNYQECDGQGCRFEETVARWPVLRHWKIGQ